MTDPKLDGIGKIRKDKVKKNTQNSIVKFSVQIYA